MVNPQQNKKNQIPTPILLGGLLLVVFVPYLIPIAAIGFAIYKLVISGKMKQKRTNTPLSSSQKSEYREQPPKPRPPQTPPARPSQSPRPAQATTTGFTQAGQPKNNTFDRSRFAKVTTDYGARHRENAKRMLDAGLIEREEYNQQIERSKSL